MQGPTLIAHAIACRRSGQLLFEGLDLSLEAGAALLVTGSNGTGKSSLLRVLAGLLSPSEGTVARTGGVGLVDETCPLDAELALKDALRFWAELGGGSSASGVVDAIGIAHLADVPVRFLSTGQKKRAALARLLGQKPGIWLLDEPLNGLDLAAHHLVEHLVAEHRAAGGIAVVASHQPFALPEALLLALGSA